MSRGTTAVINFENLRHNFKVLKELAPGKLVLVVKADAYGHGMLLAAEQLEAADSFAVAMPEEAYALRATGCDKAIVVLHGFSNQAELEKFSALKISAVIHQQAQLAFLQSCTLSLPIDAWLKVDTGMHRLGVSLAEADASFGLLRNSNNIANVYMMSHFANADDTDNLFNNIQLDNFLKVTNDIDVDCSMANSAAIMRLSQSHFEVVRPGIMLYGSSPFVDASSADLGLRAVMQFESALIEIKQIKAGEYRSV